jgi:hypothetical protein
MSIVTVMPECPKCLDSAGGKIPERPWDALILMRLTWDQRLPAELRAQLWFSATRALMVSRALAFRSSAGDVLFRVSSRSGPPHPIASLSRRGALCFLAAFLGAGREFLPGLRLPKRAFRHFASGREELSHGTVARLLEGRDLMPTEKSSTGSSARSATSLPRPGELAQPRSGPRAGDALRTRRRRPPRDSRKRHRVLRARLADVVAHRCLRPSCSSTASSRSSWKSLGGRS